MRPRTIRIWLVPVLVLVARGLVGVAQIGIGNLERAAKAQNAVETRLIDARKIRPGSWYVEVARAHRGVNGLRLEQADEIAEVAAISSAKCHR